MKFIQKHFIYNTDGKKWWSRSHISYPIWDIVDENTWRIYYSTRNENNHSRISYIDVEAENPEKILYIHNEPLLELGIPAHFDERGTLPACIVEHNGRKYLYYMGIVVPQKVAYYGTIGIAAINDKGKIPILSKLQEIPTFEKSQNHHFGYGICQVIQEQQTALLRIYNTFFTGWLSHNDPTYEIHCHQSADGLNWDEGVVCHLDINNEFEWAAPRVFIKDTGYAMIFVARGKNDFRTNVDKTYHIGYAESKDGINFHIIQQEIGIRINLNPSSFDSIMQCYPCVKQYKNRLRVLYSGNNFGKAGIGYAELENIAE
jgi:hypothetical protein